MRFGDLANVVHHMTGIQAQDECGARWSIGLRNPGSAENDIFNSIKNREILRTWLFRGTLHYAAREDLSWLLKLLAPHLIESNTRRYGQLGLAGKDFERSQATISKVLQENQEATRGELKNTLEAGGISAEGQRLPYLLQRAALDGLIYISDKRGRDMVFRLVSELNLPQSDLDRSEALTRLAERYFRSHGPATIRDFAWWSGLPLNDARQGLAGCQGVKEMAFEGESYWTFDEIGEKAIEPLACLLPPFDEYLLGYRDRDLVLDPMNAKLVNRGGGMFKPTVLINGCIAGNWQKDDRKDLLKVEVHPFAPLSRKDRELIGQAALRLGEFYGKPAEVKFIPG